MWRLTCKRSRHGLVLLSIAIVVLIGLQRRNDINEIDESSVGTREIIIETGPTSNPNDHMNSLTLVEPLQRPPDSAKVKETHEAVLRTKSGNKLILYWNTFFGSKEFHFGIGDQPFVDNGCSVRACSTTNDKSLLDQADVVVFHGPKIGDLPSWRPQGQMYVYIQREPWMNMSSNLLMRYTDEFNITMTYRSDSDVHLPYGIIRKSVNQIEKPFVDPHSKPGNVVWVVSHCKTLSQRERYVSELQKHIDVDIYGACGTLKCDKAHNTACWKMFNDRYRFVLAFENDVCKDYISEKVYRPFGYNLVPVVYGGANYSLVTPPKSVINIADFQNPKALAEYLISLSNDPAQYNEYFKWKSQGYEIESHQAATMAKGFCDLCELLHRDDYQYRRYENFRTWFTEGACDRGFIDTIM